MRQTTRLLEEAQQTGVESCEAIVRTEQMRTPTVGALRGVVRDVPRAVAVLRCQDRAGHCEHPGHSLPNGLSAPLRC
jgi:hypothetical protein